MDRKDYEDVKCCVTEREPVNMSMRQYFYSKKLDEIYGYRNSGYCKLFESYRETKSIPQYCLYTKALIDLNNRGIGYKNIHIVNLIGLSLDSPMQPDYITYEKYFNGQVRDSNFILPFYTSMWQLFSNAVTVIKAEDPAVNSVRIFNVGGGNFCRIYRDIYGIENFFIAFVEAFSTIVDASLNSHNNLTINALEIKGLTPFSKDIIKAYKACITDADKRAALRPISENRSISEVHLFDTSYRIPASITEKETNECIFANAWDSHSILGNGNFNDKSLDGYFGSNTNIALVGTPAVNPYIKYYVGQNKL
jgi:hypothetical protein